MSGMLICAAIAVGEITDFTGIVNAASLVESGADTKISAFPLKALQKAVVAPDVRVIKTIAQLPSDVRARFRESVQTMKEKNKPPQSKQIDMANPGQSWNASDNVKEGLPNRQLQFAGTAGNKCFVVFNTASIRGWAQWVAVFDVSKKTSRALGVALATARITSLAGLQKMVKSESFPKYPNSTTLSH